MKTLLFSTTSAVATMLIASVTLGLAQAAKSFPDPPVVSATNPVRSGMTALITPIEKDGQVNGRVTITPGGDGVTMIGRIAGLEPNKRYQIIVQPPETVATPKPSEEAGEPGGNAPGSGVTGAEPRPPGEDLGMLVSDANGNGIVDATLRKVDRALFPEGFTGCTVLIKRAPPLDSPGERPAIAVGKIVATPAEIPKPPLPPVNSPAR